MGVPQGILRSQCWDIVTVLGFGDNQKDLPRMNMHCLISYSFLVLVLIDGQRSYISGSCDILKQ